MVQAGIIEGSPTKDLSVLTPLAEKDAAAYFFLHTTATKWASIIYVPEGVSKVFFFKIKSMKKMEILRQYQINQFRLKKEWFMPQLIQQ